MTKALKTSKIPEKTKPIPCYDECLYYLVREMGGLGIRAKERHFDAILEHIRSGRLKNTRMIEVRAIVMAAELRNRRQELDAAIKKWRKVTTQ